MHNRMNTLEMLFPRVVAAAQVRRNDSRIATGVGVQQDYVVAILGFEMAGDFPPKVPGGASDYDSLLHAVQYQ